MQHTQKITYISDKLVEILNSLDNFQLKKINFKFEDDERYIWYYTPHEQNGLLVF